MNIENLVTRYMTARNGQYAKAIKAGQQVSGHVKQMKKAMEVYAEVGDNLTRLGHTTPDEWNDDERTLLKKQILDGLKWLRQNSLSLPVTQLEKLVRDFPV
jgi:hypothetical protein